MAEFPRLRERVSAAWRHAVRRRAADARPRPRARGRTQGAPPRRASEGIQPSIVLEIEAKIASISRARGLAIVLVEQNIEFAAALARRIYVMEKGRIAREISPENVMDEDIVRDYLASSRSRRREPSKKGGS